MQKLASINSMVDGNQKHIQSFNFDNKNIVVHFLTDVKWQKKKIAVVTGANKGIGLEICRQLLEKCVKVVLTARDETRGKEAVKKLQDEGAKDVIFHQLDVTDPATISTLKKFIQSQFGRLDILINNAGVLSTEYKSQDTFVDDDWYQEINWDRLASLMIETFARSKECIDINYNRTKRMCEAFIPLLQLSQSPRIVNVLSSAGKLKFISGENIRNQFADINNLTEARLEELVVIFLGDFKEGRLKVNGWPDTFSAYRISKVAVSAYTRIIAKNYPRIIANCVCPSHVKTDLAYNTGKISVEEGAKGPVMLALLSNGSLSGQFYYKTELSSFE